MGSVIWRLDDAHTLTHDPPVATSLRRPREYAQRSRSSLKVERHHCLRFTGDLFHPLGTHFQPK